MGRLRQRPDVHDRDRADELGRPDRGSRHRARPDAARGERREGRLPVREPRRPRRVRLRPGARQPRLRGRPEAHRSLRRDRLGPSRRRPLDPGHLLRRRGDGPVHLRPARRAARRAGVDRRGHPGVHRLRTGMPRGHWPGAAVHRHDQHGARPRHAARGRRRSQAQLPGLLVRQRHRHLLHRHVPREGRPDRARRRDGLRDLGRGGRHRPDRRIPASARELPRGLPGHVRRLPVQR